MIKYNTEKQTITATVEKEIKFEVVYKYVVNRIQKKITLKLVDLKVNSNGYLTKDLKKKLKETKTSILNTLLLIYFSTNDSSDKKTGISSSNGRIENRVVYSGTKSSKTIKHKSN